MHFLLHHATIARAAAGCCRAGRKGAARRTAGRGCAPCAARCARPCCGSLPAAACRGGRRPGRNTATVGLRGGHLPGWGRSACRERGTGTVGMRSLGKPTIARTVGLHHTARRRSTLLRKGAVGAQGRGSSDALAAPRQPNVSAQLPRSPSAGGSDGRALLHRRAAATADGEAARRHHIVSRTADRAACTEARAQDGASAGAGAERPSIVRGPWRRRGFGRHV